MLKPYYNQASFCLYHGNCIDVLKSLKENSIDLIFADPPYNLSNGGFSVRDDLVLDPFTGSSSTGIAAYNLDRAFIGIDNNLDFLNLSVKRFNQLKNPNPAAKLASQKINDDLHI